MWDFADVCVLIELTLTLPSAGLATQAGVYNERERRLLYLYNIPTLLQRVRKIAQFQGRLWLAMGSFLSILSPGSGIVGCLLLYLLSKQSRGKRSNLPPSPNGLPLIGHLHLMRVWHSPGYLYATWLTFITHSPPIRAWLWFDELSKKFKSPLIYLNLAGQDLIVINDYQTAVELVRRFVTPS